MAAEVLHFPSSNPSKRMTNRSLIRQFTRSKTKLNFSLPSNANEWFNQLIFKKQNVKLTKLIIICRNRNFRSFFERACNTATTTAKLARLKTPKNQRETVKNAKRSFSWQFVGIIFIHLSLSIRDFGFYNFIDFSADARLRLRRGAKPIATNEIHKSAPNTQPFV